MTKIYIRKCDECKKEIKNLYDYGVTTLYEQIRIGRGGCFNDYQDETIYNLVKEIQPDDFDTYGSGYNNKKEFSFCSPECFIKFMIRLYKDTYNNTINIIKNKKKETFDVSIENLNKRYGESISFFKKIQNKFSKNVFGEEAIIEANELIKEIEDYKKKLLLTFKKKVEEILS